MKRTALMVSMCSLAVAVATGGCGKKKDDKGSQVDPGGQPAKVTDQVTPPTTPKKDEKPPPPEADLQGHVRVVNLYVDDQGKSQAIDVWGKRSFKYGPVKLAENIKLGEASPWFRTAKGQSPAVFPAGQGPDDGELSGLFGAQMGEHITSTVMWEGGKAKAFADWETKEGDAPNVPKAPAAGKAFVMIRASQLRPHEKTLDPKYNPSSFYVGDGTGTCVHQRVEDEGFQAAILGGTNPTQHDVAPGKTTFTLHKWPSGDKCGSEALYTFDVEAEDGKGKLVVLYTPDGKGLANAQFEMNLK